MFNIENFKQVTAEKCYKLQTSGINQEAIDKLFSSRWAVFWPLKCTAPPPPHPHPLCRETHVTLNILVIYLIIRQRNLKLKSIFSVTRGRTRNHEDVKWFHLWHFRSIHGFKVSLIWCRCISERWYNLVCACRVGIKDIIL